MELIPEISPIFKRRLKVMLPLSRHCSETGTSNNATSERRTTALNVNREIAMAVLHGEGRSEFFSWFIKRKDARLTVITVCLCCLVYYNTELTRCEREHIRQSAPHPKWQMKLRAGEQSK
jgi:hypothetical protein